MQHLSAALPVLSRPRKQRQRAGWHGRCRRHEKIHGAAPGQVLDRNAKARIMVAVDAYNARFKQPGQHQGPITAAYRRVLEALLHRFHTDRGTFPSYERAAAAARCCRDTFYEAIKTLEEAGILSWVNRITEIRVRERDLFGKLVTRWQVIRTSNAYRFFDPIGATAHRQSHKSENPTGDLSRSKNKKSGARRGAPVDAGSARHTAELLLPLSQATAPPPALRREHPLAGRALLSPAARAAIVARMDAGTATAADWARYTAAL